MIENASMPRGVLIPVIAYPDVTEAATWICAAFGFTVRWQAGAHRAQLAVGDSAVAITSGQPQRGADHVMVRVVDLDRHRERAERHGATVSEVGEFPYGERQYTAHDHVGRAWVFTESVASVEPSSWGATVPGE
jgi:uncharacterized glyoxalase superfamily protein PhnB